MSRARLSPSSSSTSPESTHAILETPPITPARLASSPSPRAPRVADSPTSALLASALGGLSLRDAQSPASGRSLSRPPPDALRLADQSSNLTPVALGLSGMVPDAPAANSQRTRQLKHATSIDELTMLALSSSITELSMSIEEVSTAIFEIQELRHASSTGLKASTKTVTSDVSEMDSKLMGLNTRLEDVRKELAEVESQIKPLVGGPEVATESTHISFLREKWNSILAEWESVQGDAEHLGDELKEDKYLLVFNSVIKQAEDMMRSLEKILNQSHQFVWDVNRRSGKSASSTGSESISMDRTFPTSTSASSVSSMASAPPRLHPSDIQPLLSSFVALHRSLHAKVKYYSPACDRVLNMLGKGIADRTTKNGEVLRRYAELKSRWKELQERIRRIETEMRGVEDVLRGASGPEDLKTSVLDKDEDSKNKKKVSDFGNTLTPPRESPVGRISPLRRLANKISPNTTPTRPDRFWRQPSVGSASSPASPPASSAMLPSTSGTSSSPSASSSGAKATPPRPTKNGKRLFGNSPASSPPPQTPQSRPPLSHRRSTSALSASVGASARTIPRRAISPMPTPVNASLADRPRWNPSTKRTDEEREILTQSALGKGRPSLVGSTGGGGTPHASRNGRNSSMGLRPSSRLSMTSSVSQSYTDARPVSPAFSDASSAVRERPSTPSRIPRPSSVIRPRSTTPYSRYDPAGNTSIMQRMASSPSTSTSRTRPPPAPSNRYSLSRSAGPSSLAMPRSSSASQLPTTSTLGANLSPPRAVSPSPSANSSFSYRGQTPEPSIAAHAKRLANLRAPGSSRSSQTPRLPSNRAGADQSTPRANPPSRPHSSLAYDRSGAFSPLPNGDSTARLYSSNPHDPLDIAVGHIVNSLPLALHVARVDPHLSRSQAAQVEIYSARYLFSLSPLEDQRRAVMLKLVDRVGPRARKGEKKVLARVGGGWQDLESHCLSLMAQAM